LKISHVKLRPALAHVTTVDGLLRYLGVTPPVLPKRPAQRLPMTETPAAIAHRASKKKTGPSPYCAHGLLIQRCVVHGENVVGMFYASGGGTHFHRTPDCPSLARGQEKVRRRGGEVANIDSIHSLSGKIAGLDPCKTCMRVASSKSHPRAVRSASPSELEKLKVEAARTGRTLQDVAAAATSKARRIVRSTTGGSPDRRSR
jgi:hypothetical protein